jgi:hypothetical protein
MNMLYQVLFIQHVFKDTNIGGELPTTMIDQFTTIAIMVSKIFCKKSLPIKNFKQKSSKRASNLI